jgi:hypothetical protein
VLLFELPKSLLFANRTALWHVVVVATIMMAPRAG